MLCQPDWMASGIGGPRCRDSVPGGAIGRRRRIRPSSEMAENRRVHIRGEPHENRIWLGARHRLRPRRPPRRTRGPDVVITIAPATIDGRVSRRAGIDALGEAWLPDSCSSRRSSSASFRSAAACQRRAGSFRRQRRITFSRSRDSPGITSLGRSGSFPTTASSVDIFVSPTNARRPVTISYSTAPNEKTSDRGSAGLPSACSGDM